MNGLFQDLKYALRMLAKNPGFTVVAVITLALGIGAETAIFTCVDAAVLRPLPISNPNRLVRLGTKTPQGTANHLSYPNYEDIRQQVKSFSGVAVCYRADRFLNSLDESSQILVDLVSPDYFTVLGVKPFLGRVFSRELDAGPQAELSVVVSYRLWKGRLGGDPGIIGREVKLTGEPATVIGVAPPHFQGLERFVPTDAWLLASASAEFTAAQLQNRDGTEFEAVARLGDGATPAQAAAELDALGQRLAEAYPKTNRGTSFRFELETKHQARALPIGVFLMVAVGFVLLIACSNVAGLLLARAESRRHELAVRVALGASKWQLVRQFVVEGFLLSTLGGIGGLALTSWLLSLREALLPPSLSLLDPGLRVDMRVVLFTAAVTLVAILLFSVTPALGAWRIGLTNALKREEAVLFPGRHRFAVRNLLVIGQIAMSVMLVTASLLLFRSLYAVANQPVGFDLHGNLAVVNLFPLKGSSRQARQYLPPIVERAANLPGVKGATCALRILLSGSGGGRSAAVSVPGFEMPEGQSSVPVSLNAVGPDYFRTVGTRILQGRDFNPGDGPDSQKVVIISETMARRFWPHENPLGRTIQINKADSLIVGIAQDAKIIWVREAPKPYMYLPMAQTAYEAGALIVKAKGDAGAILPALRREIHDCDSSLVISGVDTSESLTQLSSWDLALESRIIGALSLIGVFLSAIGLYGVIAFLVGSRTREIGIRLALGARISRIKAIVVLQALKLILTGVAIGAVAALAVGRVMTSLLYEVKPYDPLSFVLASAMVIGIALLASYIPARRATKVDPMVALRYE